MFNNHPKFRRIGFWPAGITTTIITITSTPKSVWVCSNCPGSAVSSPSPPGSGSTPFRGGITKVGAATAKSTFIEASAGRVTTSGLKMNVRKFARKCTTTMSTTEIMETMGTWWRMVPRPTSSSPKVVTRMWYSVSAKTSGRHSISPMSRPSPPPTLLRTRS